MDAALPGQVTGQATSGSGCADHAVIDPTAAAEALTRLAKAAGQVNGVANMIRDDRYCVDVLNQILAVQKALDSVSRLIMRNYLERCVTRAIENGDPLIHDELMNVIFKHR